MANQSPKDLTPSGGMFSELALRLKLIGKLMLDRRVHPLLKALPIGTLVYLLNPIDLPGPLDDAAVIGLGMYLFVELCPPQIVEEHMRALKSGSSSVLRNTPPEDTVIDGEYRDVTHEGDNANPKPPESPQA